MLSTAVRGSGAGAFAPSSAADSPSTVEDGAKAPEAEPLTAVESIRDVVLPAIGSFLKGALVTKAATVE